MASHRKERTTAPGIAGTRTPALATAALTSVALLTQTANAAPSAEPRPGIEEVTKEVDDLYHQAETAAEKYNAVKERTDRQQERVNRLLDDAAERAQELNDARAKLGMFAAAQYRTGSSASDMATFLLSDDAQAYFDSKQVMSRLNTSQKRAVDDYQVQQAEVAKKRAEAARSLQTLMKSREELRTERETVQRKLSEARELLAKLTAEEKARLAQIEKERQEEARRKAEELARKRAEAEAARQAQEAAQQDAASPADSASTSDSASSSDSGSGTSAGSAGTADTSYATKADKALAFARAQIGKPYVWGATGPDSYDCSGLTQAAWKAAGVTLPRTTWDQVDAGTTVTLDSALPGDLIFFYDDISHVGIYIGDGMMIHAPKPGAYVREESVYYMPIHSVVRPA